MARITLVSASGALATDRYPVGGGVRILELLATHLARGHEVTILTAGSRDGEDRDGPIARVRLGLPVLERVLERDLLDFDVWKYARLSVEFERRATEWLLARGSAGVVLCNDIAEGPDFARLAEAGVRTITLFHVVVADFFSRIYLRGWLRPAQVWRILDRARRWRLSALVPRIFRLAFEKEGCAVARSQALVVPSQGMAEALAGAFPWLDRGKIHVVPWGSGEDSVPEAEAERQAEALRAEYRLDGATRVLMTMSRLSHEKGLELLLAALRRLDARAGGPPLVALICGEGAYMGGAAYVRRLKRMAGGLRRVRVVFPGYLSALLKAAHFRLAHLFVNCSRYEAYGLAIAEALRAGVPVLSTSHYGSRDLVRPPYGEIVEGRNPIVLGDRIAALVGDAATVGERRRSAREAGAGLSFASAAERLEALVRQVAMESR